MRARDPSNTFDGPGLALEVLETCCRGAADSGFCGSAAAERLHAIGVRQQLIIRRVRRIPKHIVEHARPDEILAGRQRVGAARLTTGAGAKRIEDLFN